MSQSRKEKCFELDEFANGEECGTNFERREFDSNGSSKVVEITSLDNEALGFLLRMEENGVDENSVEMEFEPFVGQCFLSEEEAFAFYQNYAQRNGFSIRKGRTDKKRGQVTRRDFFCHRYGRPPLKVTREFKKQRNRKSAKCGCTAHLRISLRKSFDIFPLEWQVTQFVSSHNHPLLSPSQVCSVPNDQVISGDDHERILLLKEAGLSVTQIERVLALEKHAKHEYHSFLRKDIQNFFDKIQRRDVENEAIDLLRYCRIEKEKNPKFKYAFTLDKEKKLEHIFWSPIPCSYWYLEYGDVIVFDTTYKVNGYELPFGIFVGVNNHGKTILFGCALLRNETTSAFQWLMKTFISLMRKSPKSILTAHDPWLTEAIATEMPFTKHSFCIWHIASNFSGWFTVVLRNQYAKWCSDFYKLYKLDTLEDFELEWHQVVEKYGLQGNKHVNGLYGTKHFWVPSYLREYFFGGMTTVRSESIHAFIRRFISSSTSLKDLVKQVDIAMVDNEQTQSHDSMLDLEIYKSSFGTMSQLEEQAHNSMILEVKSESLSTSESNQFNIGPRPSLVEYFPNYPTPDPTWCGSFEVLNSVSRSEFFDGFQAHAPGKLQHKALEFSKQMPGVLLCTMLPNSDVWVDVFHDKCPNLEDVALYFFPGSFERSKQQYIQLLGRMEAQDLVLKSCIDDVELLIFSSAKFIQN